MQWYPLVAVLLLAGILGTWWVWGTVWVWPAIGGQLGKGTPVGGISVGSSPVQTRTASASFYVATCIHCKHEWMIAS